MTLVGESGTGDVREELGYGVFGDDGSDAPEYDGIVWDLKGKPSEKLGLGCGIGDFLVLNEVDVGDNVVGEPIGEEYGETGGVAVWWLWGTDNDEDEVRIDWFVEHEEEDGDEEFFDIVDDDNGRQFSGDINGIVELKLLLGTLDVYDASVVTDDDGMDGMQLLGAILGYNGTDDEGIRLVFLDTVGYDEHDDVHEETGILGAKCSGGGGKLSWGVRETGEDGDISLTNFKYCWCLKGVVNGRVLAPEVESQSSISRGPRIPPSDLRVESPWKSEVREVCWLSSSKIDVLPKNSKKNSVSLRRRNN